MNAMKAMRVHADQFRDAANSLLSSNHAVLRIEPKFVDRIGAVFESADPFFGRSPEDKRRYERPELLEGYRGYGAEHSGPNDRPDLNETFSHVLRNAGCEELRGWVESNPVHAAMTGAAPFYVELVNGVLDELRRALNPDGDRFDCADFSYFQLNFYRPQSEKRDFLQDAHEDGHVLTVVKALQPGLEIELDGGFEPVRLARDELLLMPGSILTLMTGGRVEPLVHRVRNVAGVEKRASLMFFANASVTNAPHPWVAGEDGRLPDIGRATAEASKAFGLPSIEALAR
jgi:isopenicillin N synthase-like dioxygenase